jgi:hypothetical protein
MCMRNTLVLVDRSALCDPSSVSILIPVYCFTLELFYLWSRGMDIYLDGSATEWVV